jgi:hypothetical protein
VKHPRRKRYQSRAPNQIAAEKIKWFGASVQEAAPLPEEEGGDGESHNDEAKAMQ